MPSSEQDQPTDSNLSEITTELVEGLRQKTALLPSTIVNLLSLGWRYVEKIGEVSRWEHPMWRLEGEVIPVSYASMYDVLSKPVNG
jgi:hypothetical protein